MDTTTKKTAPPTEQVVPKPRPIAPDVVEFTEPGVTAAQKAKALHEAWTARHMVIPASLSSMIGAEIVGGIGAKAYLNTVLDEAGDSADPVERMLVEQLVLAHHRIARLYQRADAQTSPEIVKILNGAANRLLGEFRRLSLALRQYRMPPSSKSFNVVHQQNLVANGRQEVTYVDKSSGSEEKNSLSCRDKLGDTGAADANGQAQESTARSRWQDQRLQETAVD